MMISNQLGVPARSLLAAAAACASLVASTGARAEEPSPDGSREVVRPAARTARAGAAIAPTIRSLSRTWTGDVQEEFRINIRFSQSVTGFTIDDIVVTGAEKVPPLDGTGSSYSLNLTTQEDYKGPVVISIPSNVAENSREEGNIGRALTFNVDNQVPEVREAKVNGDEVVIVFSEDLDEDFIPSANDFSVSFLRDGGFNVRPVSEVEVIASEVFLTLAQPVLSGDAVSVFYGDTGANAVRDLVGNRAFGFDMAVRNITGETLTGVPGVPRNLTAADDGPTAIELEWDAPLADGGTRITGYLIEVSTDGGDTWKNLARNTRSTDTSYRDTDLEAGDTRHYRVSAINFNGAGDPSDVAKATTEHLLPDAPRRVTATARGTSAIGLSWTAPSSSGSAPITGYRIEVSRTGTSGWLVLEADTDSRATAYTHSGLSPGATRHYRVAAISRAGRSPWSSIAQATTDVTTPSAPAGLRVVPSGVGGSDQLLLTWTRPSSDGGSSITGYRIQMSPNRVSGWVTLVASTGSASTTTYLHTGLAPGTTRFYRVAAINAQGQGDYSTVAPGATNAARPGPPQNLRARAGGPTSITLTWEAPASDGGARITGYAVRSLSPTDGSWITIRPHTGSTATTFTHINLQPSTFYRYQVAAINRVGAGQWSSETATLTHADKPAAPTGLTARAIGTSRIDLSWTAPRNTGGASIRGYRIEASSDEGRTWSIIRRDTRSAATTLSDVDLEPATTRHYRVAAINIAGNGPFSNVAQATTDATLPGVPQDLTAEADGTSEIDLSWQAPSDDGGAQVTGYRVQVSENGGATWQDLVPNTRSTRTTYSHTGLEPATTRHYRVSAINRIGLGGASRVASATTDATVPDAPTGLVATAITATQIDLAWVAPAYDGGAPITGYRIEVSKTGAAWTDLQPNTGTVGTTYSHTGLLPGSTRFYRVSAINRAGTGAPSGVASAATDDPVERAGRLNTRVLPHVAAAMTSSTVSAIADRIDAVANGMGMERRMETGLSSMAASLSAPGAGGVGLGRQDRSGLSSLFGGASFQMPLGATDAPQETSTGTRMGSWGAGEYHYLGEPGSSVLDWSGNMVSAHVGVDGRLGPDILAGLAASYSSGSFDFTDRTGASPVTGTYATTMTSVNPYLAWFSGDRGNAVWGSAGYGWGDIEVDDEREALRTSPVRTFSGAAGGSYQLLESGIGGIRVKAEGWAGQVMVDGSERVDSVTLAMQRGKLALEWTQGFRSAAGHEVAIMLEGGMRYDNGDGVNGTSGEVGGGLRYTNAGVGVTAEGRGRLLVSAREGYEEWGLGGMILFDPATRGQGLSIRLAPSYGDAASGVNQLWERGVSGAVRDHDMGRAANLDGEVAYGVAGFQGTPYSGFYLAENGVRAFSSGVRYNVGSGSACASRERGVRARWVGRSTP